MGEIGASLPKEELLRRAREGFTGASVPHNQALGVDVTDVGPGLAVLEMPYDERLIGNPDTGVLHGGAVTSLMDAAAGLSVFMKLTKPTRVATIDLRIDYLRPAEPGRALRARAECYRLAREVAFVRVVAFHDDSARPVASGAGSFMVFGDEGRSPTAEALRRGDG